MAAANRQEFDFAIVLARPSSLAKPPTRARLRSPAVVAAMPCAPLTTMNPQLVSTKMKPTYTSVASTSPTSRNVRLSQRSPHRLRG